jgi:hypothetical protein
MNGLVGQLSAKVLLATTKITNESSFVILPTEMEGILAVIRMIVRGEFKKSGVMARIVPNHSVQGKRNERDLQNEFLKDHRKLSNSEKQVEALTSV